MSRELTLSALIALVAVITSACAPDTLPARPPNATKAPTPQAVTLVRYACNNDAVVQASYPTADRAVVQYDGNTYNMTLARSADGARYVGDTLEWWSKGTGPQRTATLFAHDADGTGETILSCAAVTGGHGGG